MQQISINISQDINKFKDMLSNDEYVILIYDKSVNGEQAFEKYRNYIRKENISENYFEVELDLVDKNKEVNMEIIKELEEMLSLQIKKLPVLIMREDFFDELIIEGIRAVE